MSLLEEQFIRKILNHRTMITYRTQTVSFFAIIIGAILFATVLLADARASNYDLWQIETSDSAQIHIEDLVIRPQMPETFFGFNINFIQFQKQLWDRLNQRLKTGIVEHLKPFKNAVYRYPGGLVSNTFDWTGAIGPWSERTTQSSFYEKQPRKVSFGIDEYLKFVSDVGGQPWYVLNLVGVNPTAPMELSDIQLVAEKNADLVSYLTERIDNTDTTLYLELGNELDRSKYEWSPEMYINRSLATIEKTEQKNQPLEFIPALRDFKTRSKKNKDSFLAHPDVLIQQTANALPMVKGYSLHHYYDADRPDKTSRSIPFWLTLMSKSIQSYETVKKTPPQIWITEHGRQSVTQNPGKDSSKSSTSNLSAAISTADYLIALALIPEVQGAVWHGLNAGPWQLFDYSARHNDLRPRPIYWGFRVLFAMDLKVGLATRTMSPNLSNYKGGYDIRSSAFKNEQGDELGIRVINRYSENHMAKVKYQPFAGQQVEIQHYYISSESGKDPENEDNDYKLQLMPSNEKYRFTPDGELEINLPPSSVSTFLIRKI